MYLGAGSTPEDIAQAMLDGKPLSPDLARLYARVLRETIADLAKENGIVVEPEPSNVMHFPRR